VEMVHKGDQRGGHSRFRYEKDDMSLCLILLKNPLSWVEMRLPGAFTNDL
jgi:hypothetical protein